MLIKSSVTKILWVWLYLFIASCNLFHKNTNKKEKTGIINLKEIRHLKWFKVEYKNYTPDTKVLDSIKLFYIYLRELAV